MTLVRLLLSVFVSTLVFSGAAKADIYGYVEDGRVKLMYTNIAPTDPRFKLYKRDGLGSGDLQPQSSWAPYTGTRYTSQIMAAAAETQVEPALIHAVIQVESSWNPRARSPAGAVGLMQLMPGTAKRYGVKDRTDPAQSIMGGAKYLKALLEMFGNDLKLVLAAYNAGEEAVMKYGRRIPPYRETIAYVPKVMKHYRIHSGNPSAPKLASADTES